MFSRGLLMMYTRSHTDAMYVQIVRMYKSVVRMHALALVNCICTCTLYITHKIQLYINKNKVKHMKHAVYVHCADLNSPLYMYMFTAKRRAVISG
jgi:hypothetical protein